MVIYSFKSRKRKRLHAKSLQYQNMQYAATNAHLNADMEHTQPQWKQLVQKIERNRELLEQISAEKERMGRKHNTEMILLREDIGVLIDSVQGLVNILRHNGIASTTQASTDIASGTGGKQR
jgi:septal ring factor EnvC (AmiA/AmiB activator)